MSAHPLEAATGELFTELRAASKRVPGDAIPDPDSSEAEEVVAALRHAVRPHQLPYLRAAWALSGQWRLADPRGLGLRFVDSFDHVVEPTPKELEAFFSIRRDDFFFRAAQAMVQTWDASLLLAEKQPELADNLQAIERLYAELLAPPSADTRPCLNLRSWPSRREEAFKKHADEQSWRVQRHTARHRTWLELLPAANIAMGFVYVAAALTRSRDHARVARVVRNSRPFLAPWGSLSSGAFIAVRTPTVNPQNFMQRSSFFALIDSGTEEERLTFNQTAHDEIRRALKSAEGQKGLRFRHGCPGAQVQATPGGDNAIVATLDFSAAIYEAFAPLMKS